MAAEVTRRNDALRISLPRMQCVWFPEVWLMLSTLRVRCLAKLSALAPDGVSPEVTAITAMATRFVLDWQSPSMRLV